MQKIYWLYDLSQINPFKTKYFVWLDSGPCSLSIRSFGKETALKKLRYFMKQNRFFITKSPYPEGPEIHGCPRSIITRFTNGIQPDHVCKGWIMGGSGIALEKILIQYDGALNRTLNSWCLGTEETVFTVLYHSQPWLFHVYQNGGTNDIWNDNMCSFFGDHSEYETDFNHGRCSS